MAFQDLKEFVRALDDAGELRTIDHEVDARLEISEICDRVVKRGGPALLFANVRGHDMPVLINAFGTMRRMEIALGVGDIEEVAADIAELMQPPAPASWHDKLQMLPKLKRFAGMAPKMVSRAPCQEVVRTDDADLTDLPILTCWPGDGGPYITLPLVITSHPEKGTRNVGMYRLQVFDDRHLGLHWQRHKGAAEHYRAAERLNRPLEVAIALGPDPATIYAASAPLPPEIDELMLSGFLRHRPVEMVNCKTIDVQVPANSQIVIEGLAQPGVRRTEGPFGDHTGYYSLADEYPVLEVTAITHQREPVYPTIIVGPPPMEDGVLGKVTERIFLPLIRAAAPEVVDLNLPVEGIFHNLAIVSIEKRYPGHARKVMHALWGLGQLMFTKVILVVDSDCDVQDLREVCWKAGVHIDPARDILLSEGPYDVLDFATDRPHVGGKLGIDATRKLPEEGYHGEWPPVIEMTPEVKERIDAIWDQLGID